MISLIDYQSVVNWWMLTCFGKEVASDKVERNHRFCEESLELVQSLGMSCEDVLKMVEYTYSRPKGEPAQEVGGVMVTLTALCSANDIVLSQAAERELARILRPDTMEIIRQKQLNKPHGSPLPE